MDIPFDAEVTCTDGACGRPSCLIINPITRKVTHLVVRREGWAGSQVLVPVDLIAATSAHRIDLRCTRKDLIWLDPFEEMHYLGDDLSGLDYAGENYRLLPYGVTDSEQSLPFAEERIPPGELAFHRGAHVQATVRRIGQVDEFLVEPADDYITHLVLREGHLWGQKDVTIPVGQIDRLEDDVIHLKLSKHEVQALLAVPVRRHWEA